MPHCWVERKDNKDRKTQVFINRVSFWTLEELTCSSIKSSSGYRTKSSWCSSKVFCPVKNCCEKDILWSAQSQQQKCPLKKKSDSTIMAWRFRHIPSISSAIGAPKKRNKRTENSVEKSRYEHSVHSCLVHSKLHVEKHTKCTHRTVTQQRKCTNKKVTQQTKHAHKSMIWGQSDSSTRFEETRRKEAASQVKTYQWFCEMLAKDVPWRVVSIETWPERCFWLHIVIMTSIMRFVSEKDSIPLFCLLWASNRMSVHKVILKCPWACS